MLNMNTSETLFPSTVIEWNKLDNIWNSKSVSAFKKNKSLNLSDHVLIVRLMCLVLKKLNYLQDYKLG